MFTAAELEERKRYLGGSEIAAVLGLDRFRGPLDVYLAKVEDWQTPVNEDMERGTFLEEGLARWYAHRTGYHVTGPGPHVHPGIPFARCSPDRFAVVELRDVRLVSIKAPRWGHDVPDGHVLQLQWEDAVCTAAGVKLLPEFHLVSLVDGDLRILDVQRDLELQAWLLDFAQGWWARHVVARVPPALDGTATGNAWLKKRFPRDTRPVRAATLDETVALLELRDAEAVLERAEENFEVAAQKVKEAVADAGGIESEAVGRVTWKADRNGKRSLKPKWRKQ